jgi:hypothetical protein
MTKNVKTASELVLIAKALLADGKQAGLLENVAERYADSLKEIRKSAAILDSKASEKLRGFKQEMARDDRTIKDAGKLGQRIAAAQKIADELDDLLTRMENL